MGTPSQAGPAFVRLAGHPLRWHLLTELAAGDLRVRELVARVGQPQNLVSYHLRLLRDGGLVTAARSSFDGRDTYYHLDLDRCGEALSATGHALHPGLRLVPAPTPPAAARPAAVLFVCTGNSARSPVAEALLRHRTDGRVEAASAGTDPGPRPDPRAVRVMRERFGIDLGGHRPRRVDGRADRRFDHVITLCDRAREACPDLGDRPRRVHWSIPDPATGDDGVARAVDDIDTRIRHLLPVLAAAPDPKG